MNKKGFTLIELLAVIVILAIIAVITVPMIMNVIDKAKLGALEDSAYGLIESANLWYAENAKDGINDTKFTIEDNVQTSDNTEITTLLNYKGTVDKGYVSILSTGKVAICVDNGNNKVEIGYNDTKTTTSNGTCDGTFKTSAGLLSGNETSDFILLQNRMSSLETKVNDLETENQTLKNTIDNIGTTVDGLISGTVTFGSDESKKMITLPKGTWLLCVSYIMNESYGALIRDSSNNILADMYHGGNNVIIENENESADYYFQLNHSNGSNKFYRITIKAIRIK